MGDLLTAVLAAEHGLTVMHCDSDLGIAAETIDVESHWVASHGSPSSPSSLSCARAWLALAV